MKIEGLLAIAGDLPLKKFNWGAAAVKQINLLLADHQQLTVEVTGSEMLAMIRQLPPQAQQHLLAMEGSVTEMAVACSPPAPAKPGTTVRVWVPVAMAAATAVIALMVAYRMSSGESVDGLNHGIVKTVLQALVEMAKLFLPVA